MKLTVTMSEAAAIIGTNVKDVRRKLDSGRLLGITLDVVPGQKRTTRRVTLPSLAELAGMPVELLVELLAKEAAGRPGKDRSMAGLMNGRVGRPRAEEYESSIALETLPAFSRSANRRGGDAGARNARSRGLMEIYRKVGNAASA